MKFWQKYGGWLVSAAVGLVICLLVVAAEQADATSVTAMLSDGCFVAGVLLAGLGGLIWIANFGGFNALGYGGYLLLRKLSPSRSKFESRKSYLEYSLEKSQQPKASKAILVTGLAFLLLSLLFVGLYKL